MKPYNNLYTAQLTFKDGHAETFPMEMLTIEYALKDTAKRIKSRYTSNTYSVADIVKVVVTALP